MPGIEAIRDEFQEKLKIYSHAVINKAEEKAINGLREDCATFFSAQPTEARALLSRDLDACISALSGEREKQVVDFNKTKAVHNGLFSSTEDNAAFGKLLNDNQTMGNVVKSLQTLKTQISKTGNMERSTRPGLPR